MNATELIDEAVSLPVEESALVVDLLLRSPNQPESGIDKNWSAVAKRRLTELRSGALETVPGGEVFVRGQTTVYHRGPKIWLAEYISSYKDNLALERT